MREGLGTEGLHDDVHLLLEEIAIGLGVEHRSSESLDLARVVSAAHPEGDAPAGQNVGGGVVLGQPERVPHGGDVEAAPDAKPRGQVRQVDGEHQDVGDALVALVLEVVLGQPEGVVAVLVHAPGDGLRLLEHGGQVLVRIAALIGGRGQLPHVAQVDVSRVDVRELGDHPFPPRRAGLSGRAAFCVG